MSKLTKLTVVAVNFEWSRKRPIRSHTRIFSDTCTGRIVRLVHRLHSIDSDEPLCPMGRFPCVDSVRSFGWSDQRESSSITCTYDISSYSSYACSTRVIVKPQTDVKKHTHEIRRSMAKLATATTRRRRKEQAQKVCTLVGHAQKGQQHHVAVVHTRREQERHTLSFCWQR